MFITLLYASAFLFFIADRKIKRSYLAGIAVTLIASWPFSFETLYYGYQIRKYISGFIPDFDYQKRNFPTLIFTVLVALIFTGILMLMARLWSRDLYRIPKDEIKSRKMAKRIFIAASVISGVVALYLFNFKIIRDAVADIPESGYFLSIFDRIGINFLFLKPVYYLGAREEIMLAMRISNTVYVALLFMLSILCLILINTKKVKYKDLKVLTGSKGSRVPAVAMTFSLSGLFTFFTMVQRGYLTWSSEYRLAQFCAPFYYSMFYGSYNASDKFFYHQIQFGFCMFVRGVIAAGIVVLLISLIYMIVRKLIRKNLFSFIFSILLILASSECILWMMAKIEKFHSIK